MDATIETLGQLARWAEREHGANMLLSNDRGNGSAGPFAHSIDELDDESTDEELSEVTEDEDPEAWALARAATQTFAIGSEPIRVFIEAPAGIGASSIQRIWAF